MSGVVRAFASSLLLGPRAMVVACLLAVAGLAIGSLKLHPGWLVLPGAAGLLVGCCAGRKRLALLLSLLPFLFWSYLLWRLPRPGPADLLYAAHRHIAIFQGEVVRVLPATAAGARFEVAPRALLFPGRKALSGRTLLNIYGSAPALRPGDVIEVRARVLSPEGKVYPWHFDYAEYLSRRGIFTVCRAQGAELRRLAGAPAGDAQGSDGLAAQRRACFSDIERFVADTRRRIVDTHRLFAGRDAGDLLTSMVLGDRAVDLPESIEREFRNVGLSHLLAASGFNLTLVTGVTWWLSRLFIRSVWGVNLNCLLAMALFVILAGASPSVVRAAIMCSLVLLFRCLLRTLYLPAALSFAFLATVVMDPLAISDVGLQFSYAASAAIICGAERLSSLFCSTRTAKCLRWLVEAASVVLLAQLAVLPLQLWYFWQFGALFLPANLAVAPLVPLVTVVGFISSGVILLDPGGVVAAPIAAVLDWLAAHPLRLMLALVHWFSMWEGATLHLGPPEPWSVFAYALAFVVFVTSLRSWRWCILASIVLALSLVALMWRPAPPAATLACFAGAVVVIDDKRQASGVGLCERGRTARFLSYMGAKMWPQTDGWKASVAPQCTTIKVPGSGIEIVVILPGCDLSSVISRLPSKVTAVVVPATDGRAVNRKQWRRELVQLVARSHPYLVVLAHPRRTPLVWHQLSEELRRVGVGRVAVLGQYELVFTAARDEAGRTVLKPAYGGCLRGRADQEHRSGIPGHCSAMPLSREERQGPRGGR